MSEGDRTRWDRTYADRGIPTTDAIGVDAVFAAHRDAFPAAGHAIDVACGQGAGAIWLARRGLRVHGFDISAVAITQARALAERSGVGGRCRFDVVDLDDGLPGGPPADVIYSARFRDRRLDEPMMGRLAPGGLLALSALSQVGGSAGRFRAAPGELCAAFPGLEVIAAGEGQGLAWLLARRRGNEVPSG
ncbi:class I SAM-dependent methyltransferase [[Mycobacterium] crassicus]|uniref:Class I SAM-dependent methyltransferase n=1 Tax=[Mycobacterium] crassicus TaxID=2872309 RepID=A0ABU5XND6_9MYCO|nr:class I SAM-dependent methyltransferase [Mycolicibacter sp. MYC098]MEB3023698.1 class I SAM-dependent methyltransferase [Mycolicibacter sp. MYC098]